MTANKALLTNLRTLHKSGAVSFPDGTTQSVTLIGDVILHPKITLRNLLYIPAFKHNLLSIGRLLDRERLLIQFSMGKCVIQGLVSDFSMILGSREGGLYKYRGVCADSVVKTLFSSNKPQCANVEKDVVSSSHVLSLDNKRLLDLFHARLGHTSLVKMKHINELHCSELQSFFL
ncbi:hypothetical protein RND81_06G086100 [Saponaria officinalis]|uniref:Retrovirus-related Pol polyprotein from transposon TNT 1-94-like beta-barrel domain-containing protein n=1 Tax=Saponaria officinalis TaxID=3572 RepID=A0AAW1K7Q2_SAPOF